MIWYFIAILLIAFDQISKYLVVNNMTLSQSIPVIRNIFHITYVINYGAAFGIFKNQRVFFILITIVILAILIVIYKQINFHNKLSKIAFTLVISGALGNLIDRIRLGYVVDFFDFRIWPVFNIADMSIVIGAILLSVFLVFIEN